MIGLDTNVLVRYLVQDDDDHSPRARRLVDSLDDQHQGFISVVALAEVHWVLRSAYRVSRKEAAAIVGELLRAQELVLQAPDAVRGALARMGDDVDFADALIGELGDAAGCDWTATFDRRAAARLPGMRLVD